MANHRFISLPCVTFCLFGTAFLVGAALMGRVLGRREDSHTHSGLLFSTNDPDAITAQISKTRQAVEQILNSVQKLEKDLHSFGTQSASKWKEEPKATKAIVTTAPGGDLLGANPLNAQVLQSLQNWKVRNTNPELAAKSPTQSKGCSLEALKSNAEAVQQVTKIAEGEWRGETKDVRWALDTLRDASEDSPECVVVLLNYAIVLFYTGDDAGAMRVVERALASEGENARVVQWKAILLEATGERHLAVYKKAQQLDPDMSFRYHGITPTDSTSPMKLFTWESNPRIKDDAFKALMTCMRTLLLCKEFCTYGTGDPAVAADGMALFHKMGGTTLPSLVDQGPLRAVQTYYRTLVEGGYLPMNDTQAIRYYLYNDAVSRFLQVQGTAAVSRISNERVKPSYTYFTAYIGHADLKPHLDRAQCAYTLTLQIDISPPTAVWGFGFDDRTLTEEDLALQKRGHQRTDPAHEHWVYLRPGDGGLIRGSRTMHFREQLPGAHKSYHVFLHYVPWDFSKSLN